MSSEGTGSPISAQDALDLLHKLITELTKVQAVFTAAEGRVRTSLSGRITLAPDDTLWVMYDNDRPMEPFFAFDPDLAIVRKYGDFRSMLDGGEGPFDLRFRSVLGFVFKDGSTLALFEFSGEDELH